MSSKIWLELLSPRIPFLNCGFLPLQPFLQADHLSRRGKPLPHQDSLDIELEEEKPNKRSIITVEELTEIERLEDLDTCMVRHLELFPRSQILQILQFTPVVIITKQTDMNQ